MRIRYSRTDKQTDKRVRDYSVRTQDKPRGRWAVRGVVTATDSCVRETDTDWTALGVNASAWTARRRTRAAAVADMLAGRTFLD
jgi:hypothetical protein